MQETWQQLATMKGSCLQGCRSATEARAKWLEMLGRVDALLQPLTRGQLAALHKRLVAEV